MNRAGGTSERSAERDSAFDALVCDVSAELEAGHLVDVDALAAKHPEHADRLRKLLPTLEAVAELGHLHSTALPSLAQSSGRPGPGRGALGDFRIIREIGRGGMGVVYEAEQLSLNRRVALKVLPFAAVLDPRQLARFKSEAQAAAHLHHTNIVPVFSVGCEGGVHYYAMQFIEGSSLATVIRELRQLTVPDAEEAGKAPQEVSQIIGSLTSGCWAPGDPGVELPEGDAADSGARPLGQSASALAAGTSTQSPAFFRSAARLGVQAAQALDYAHGMGVVHRDIKPSNLLVDSKGQVWITDFGLATCQKADVSLTMTGDLLGTARYMSPEQALGGRIPLDQRTDVYSLGATLYEVLALRAAFEGHDRRELLRKITDQDPAPLREWNRAVPADLETIVLKAMAKEPLDRYATARELADDLRRFLEYKPIKARRPTVLQRTSKWARRHRTLTWSAAAVLCLATIGLAVSTALIWREQGHTAAALRQARVERGRTEAERRRAAANLDLALRALDEVYIAVAARRLPHEANLTEADRKLLDKALRFYRRFARDNAGVLELRHRRAAALQRVATIEKKLGRLKQAERAFREAVHVLEGLQADFPEEPKYLAEWAINLRGLAAVLGQMGRGPESREISDTVLGIFEELAGGSPDGYAHDLAISYGAAAGRLIGEHRLQEAEEFARQSIALQEELARAFPSRWIHESLIGCAFHTLGTVLDAQADADGAREALEKALLHQEAALRLAPGIADARERLGSHYSLLGSILLKLQDRPGAATALQQGAEIWGQLALDMPNVPLYPRKAASMSRRLADLLGADGRTAESQQRYREAAKLWARLADKRDGSPEHRHSAAGAWRALASLLDDSDRDEKAGRAHHRALELYEQLAAEFPSDPEYQSDVGASLHNLALTLSPTRDIAKARELVEKAIGYQRAALGSRPGVPHWRRFLSNHYHFLGTILRRLGDHEGAERAYRQCVRIREELAARTPSVSTDVGTAAMASYSLGEVLEATGQVEESRRSYGRAIELWTKLAEEPGSSPKHRRQVAGTYCRLGILLREAGRRQEAEDAYRRALELYEQLAAESPSEPACHSDLGTTLHDLAIVLIAREKLTEAERLLGKALVHQQAAVRADPRCPRYHYFLGKHYYVLSDVQCKREKRTEAAASLRRCIEVRVKLVGEHPQSAENCERLAAAYRALGHLLWEADLHGEAGDAFRRSAEAHLRSIKLLEKLARECPDVEEYRRDLAVDRNHLAWLLATAPDLCVRDPDRAYSLAVSAARACPSARGIRNTLGVACYRAGKWEEAIAALKESMRLCSGGDSFDYFFLAMSHSQLGRRTEARQWYDRAVKWMERYDPKDRDLRQFRAEAVELLGIGADGMSEGGQREGEP